MRRKYKRKIISDINVTPFVDVLLVLLVIFMISAPMLNGNIDINLPKGSATKTIKHQQNKIIISVKDNGVIYLGDQDVKFSQLDKKLLKFTNNNLNSTILIKADKNLNYGTVMNIIKKVNDIGFSSASLITKIEE